MHIRVFDHADDGALSAGRVWAETTGAGQGAPDGLKIDVGENVYCCGPGGIHVFAPDATCPGVIRTLEVPANFTWGDRDMCSLVITPPARSTASRCVCRASQRLSPVSANQCESARVEKINLQVPIASKLG